MSNENIDNLVICSTLNQITNYLIIKKYNPKRIFNITYSDDAIDKMNINMKNEDWDKYLANEVCGKDKFDDIIPISSSHMYSVKDIKEQLKEDIIDKCKDEPIYWHITGGQRIIALAVYDLIKGENGEGDNITYEERKEDKIIYIEGNTEKLIVMNNRGEYVSDKKKYFKQDLTLEQALTLTGFDTKKILDSTNILKGEDKKEIYKKEIEFYKKLYEIICTEKERKIKIDDNTEDTLRNLLVKSNSIKNSKGKTERQDFIKNLFDKILVVHSDLKEIEYYQRKKDSKDDNEFNKSYPVGYILEKIAGYRIYDLIKNDNRIVDMRMSMKTYFEDSDSNKKGIIDELDIVLLTNTGKIINFECKSGEMSGDNAKSTKYTTYRLSGVFGMPILISPFYQEEIKDGSFDERFKQSAKALNAAKAAELEVFPIDGLKEGIEKLLKNY